jgi:iron(III) transport system permease protein
LTSDASVRGEPPGASARIAASSTARRVMQHAPAWLLVGACVGLVTYLSLVPLGFLLWQSVHGMAPAGAVAPPTLDNYRLAYLNRDTARLFANSLGFAVATSLIAFVIGSLLAWVNERTNTPFKRLFFALSIVPLVIPGVLFVVAWILLGSPRIGLVNRLLQALFNTDFVFVNVYSLWGMAFVDGLHYSPMAFLLMTAAFRAMDPALEEAALMSGASIRSVAWHVTLKLSWPAAFATLLILFVRALESFEVPALLGLPAGIHVFTSAIYAAIHRYPGNVGLASAYAVSLLVLTSLGLWFQSRLAARGDRYSTVTGRGFRPRTIDLGRWRHAAAGGLLLYFLLLIGLPFLALLWSSFQRFYAVPSLTALDNLTLDPYRFVFAFPSIARATANSVVLSAGTATLVMLVTSVVCWITVKSRVRGRSLLDHLASLPIVVPGLVLGLALMMFYLHVDIGIYGSLWILLIAYVTRFLPYGMRYNSAAMLTIHRELTESAATSGASWWSAFRHIVLPLLKPGLVAGWIYVAIVSVRELSSSILLYGPGTEVLSIVIWELWENGQYVELSALGVLMIVALFALVLLAQRIGTRFGVATA